MIGFVVALLPVAGMAAVMVRFEFYCRARAAAGRPF